MKRSPLHIMATEGDILKLSITVAIFENEREMCDKIALMVKEKFPKLTVKALGDNGDYIEVK